MNKFSDKILQEITKRDIKPIPKWLFICSQITWWFLFSLSILVGSLTVAFSIFMIKGQDWDVFSKNKMSLAHTIMVVTPYIWIVVLGILAGLSSFYFKHIKKAYKKPFKKMFLGSIVLSLIIGVSLSFTDLVGHFDNYLSTRCPVCQKALDSQSMAWMRPEQGFLSGVITDSADGYLIINDLKNNHWRLIFNDQSTVQAEADLAIGQKIKVIGITTDRAGEFLITQIKPWSCNCFEACGPSCGGKCAQAKNSGCQATSSTETESSCQHCNAQSGSCSSKKENSCGSRSK